jgi:fumarate reductase flavoprotein subunit
MLKLALCVAYGALQRTESRGAHYREDYSQRNDRDWLKRTLATWKNENDTLPTLTYEDIDVMSMELPPGWRGYGAKDYIDHADTPQRLAQIEQIKGSLAGSDRFAIQAAVMPYDHLLPERFQGHNERLEETLP